MEDFLTTWTRRIHWEAMEKNDIRLAKLAEHYFITCQITILPVESTKLGLIFLQSYYHPVLCIPQLP